MLGLVAIGSVLTVVYLFVEFVWWSPTTNDRRNTAALGLRRLYKKLRASGAKQLHPRVPPLGAAKPIRKGRIAMRAATPKDLQVPSFDVPPDLTARVNRTRVNRSDARVGECRPNSS
jgi:hypothetical protein